MWLWVGTGLVGRLRVGGIFGRGFGSQPLCWNRLGWLALNAPKSLGAFWVPGMVCQLAVGTPRLGRLTRLESLQAGVCVVPSAADGTHLVGGALGFVVPEPLTMKASQRFQMIWFDWEGSPEPQVDLGWDFPLKCGHNCLCWKPRLAVLAGGIQDIWKGGEVVQFHACWIMQYHCFEGFVAGS